MQRPRSHSLSSSSRRATLALAVSGDTSATAARSDSGALVTPEALARDTADVLAAERRIWEGLKSSDHSVLDTLFAEAVDMHPMGITLQFTPGAANRALAGCVIKTYAMDSAHVKVLSADQRLLTYKATYDWTCGGQRLPSPAYEMALWQRKGRGWALLAHAAAITLTAR